MSRSLIYTVNNNAQAVAADGAVALGTVIRRYGCNLSLSGNGIMVRGSGYYTITGTITVEPAAIGNITATLYRDGVAIPGVTASGYAAAAEDPVTLPLSGVVRESGYGDTASAITCVLDAAANVTNIAITVEKS